MALSMYGTRHLLIAPILHFNGLDLAFSPTVFALLVLSIVLLGAGGNVINDIQDVEADKINKPGDNVVASGFSVKMAWGMYYTLTTIGMLLGLYTAFYLGEPWVFMIHIFIGLSLWYYSVRLTNVPLIGNILIASLLALLPIIVMLYDLIALFYTMENGGTQYQLLGVSDIGLQSLLAYILLLVLAYSMLVYLCNISRELVKDIVDLEGDRAFNYKTYPVVFGVPRSKRLLSAYWWITMALTMGVIAYVRLYFVVKTDWSLLMYAFLLLLPLVAMKRQISAATTRSDFKNIASFNKIIQVLGIASMVYFYWLYH